MGGAAPSRWRYYAYRVAGTLTGGGALLTLLDRLLHALTGTSHGGTGW